MHLLLYLLRWLRAIMREWTFRPVDRLCTTPVAQRASGRQIVRPAIAGQRTIISSLLATPYHCKCGRSLEYYDSELVFPEIR